MHNEYLLSDEQIINEQDYNERKQLIEAFKKMPEEFFSKLRHFQPQIGCLNACSICSKHASMNVSEWTKERIRNVIAAIKYSTPRKELPLIVWDRNNHRSGVIFSYLDNDIGFYENLDFFISLAYRELGVKTRISTVGFSRFNKKLNNIHKRISNNVESLGGVRISFTPYAVGWKCKNKLFDKKEYQKDMINFFKIYKRYYKSIGSGSRRFCIELRYKPFVQNENVYIFNNNKKKVICCGNYLYISCDDNIKFINTEISDPFNHRLSLNNEGIKFKKIYLNETIDSIKDVKDYLKKELKIERIVNIYRVKNKDGYYYAVDPQLTDNGCYGIYIYPNTITRKKSGIISVERYFLNELLKYKNELELNKKNHRVTWKDAKKVIKRVKEKTKYRSYVELNFINNEILPMINCYYKVLRKSGYSASSFFDKGFTIDTGIICNLGRAINEFKGLVSSENEPLTLNHERNYGSKNSTMTVEGVAWRLSCDYDNKIIIEKLNLSDTSSSDGQVKLKKEIKLETDDIKISFDDLKKDYYIPGQRRR